MKHLKLFENNPEEYWLVTYDIHEQPEVNYTLYKDKESAKNDIIETINSERLDLEAEDYTDEHIFTDVDKAMDWYEQKFTDITIGYERIYLSKPYELSDKTKLIKQTRKFNL